MLRFAFLAASVNAVMIHKRAPFGDSDDAYVGDTAKRNAMYDCTGDGTVNIGASNDMTMRVVQAKVSAISGDDPKDLESFKSGVKKVQKFKRYAAQDCEGSADCPKKKDMDESAPYVHRMNYHGPGSQVEKANQVTMKALEKAVEIKREVLGEQFAKVEDVDHLD